MTIFDNGMPFQVARKTHPLTLRVLVEVCFPLDSLVVHLDFTRSDFFAKFIFFVIFSLGF